LSSAGTGRRRLAAELKALDMGAAELARPMRVTTNRGTEILIVERRGHDDIGLNSREASAVAKRGTTPWTIR
jgi:hypothetical protein